MGPSGSRKIDAPESPGPSRPTRRRRPYRLENRDVTALSPEEPLAYAAGASASSSRASPGAPGFCRRNIALPHDLGPESTPRQRAERVAGHCRISAWNIRPTTAGPTFPVVSASQWPSPAPPSWNPPCFLADRPTGNLDRHTGDEVVHCWKNSNGRGVTLVVVTRPALYARAKRQLVMEDGRLKPDSRPEV